MIVNTKIMGNPFNWVIILLMVYIGTIGLKIFTDYINTKRN